MATVNEKMTAIADEVRTLSGTNDTMGLDAMASHVKTANEDVDEQTDLIAQIKTVANSLPEASGSGGGASDSYDCEVTFNVVANAMYCFDGRTSFSEGTPFYGIRYPTNMASMTVYLKSGSLFHAAASSAQAFTNIVTTGDITLLQNTAFNGATLQVNGSGTITF